MRNEWGGFVPLEKTHTEMPRFSGMSAMALNSGRAAVYAALRCAGATTAWVPAWLCPTVHDFLAARGIVVREYHVSHDFLPRDVSLGQNEMIVWTNWLGCVPRGSKEAVVERYRGRLIIDNCHAYFELPHNDAYNVYSCRKFLGVPHGAFLVADRLDYSAAPTEEASLSGVSMLEVADRLGSNAAYDAYLAHEQELGDSYLAMNGFVRCAISGVDEHAILEARRRNFDVLRQELGEYAAPGFDLEAKSPIWFPFYAESDALRAELVSRKVFVPRLWRRILEDPEATQFEGRMARWLMPLPVDHRYDQEDMRHLAAVVRSALAHSTKAAS